MNALSRIESSEVGSTIFSNPVDAVSAGKNDQVVVDGALNNFSDLADVLNKG